MVDVALYNEQKDLCVSHRQIQAVVEQFLDVEQLSCDLVEVHLVDSKRIADLHSEYFDDPTTTDCISFPIDEPNSEEYCVLGTLFLCPKTAIDYAKSHGGEPYEELTLYLVHGLLHLIGYDDIEEQQKAEMRQQESKHMRALKDAGRLLIPLEREEIEHGS